MRCVIELLYVYVECIECVESSTCSQKKVEATIHYHLTLLPFEMKTARRLDIHKCGH